MIVYTVALWALSAVTLLLACADPKRIYWSLQAWRYRRPEANEPSGAGYEVQRGRYVIAALLLFGVGGFFWYWEEVNTTDAGEARDAVQRTRHILETEPWPSTPRPSGGIELEPDYTERLDAALKKANEADAPGIGPQYGGVTADSAGKSKGGGESFEITNEDSKFPQCLTLRELGYVPESGSTDETTYSVHVHNGACSG